MQFRAADLFCGAGGTSTGMVRAARRRGIDLRLVAVNHWAVAVATHTANHPWARHVCADLASVEADPSRLVPDGALELLVASPECTHHSNARGGKPCSDQSRASAWHVLHWCERLNVQEVLVENVREFADWGPLLAQSIRWRGKRYPKWRPDPRRKGDTFRAWAAALESLGYRVEWRILNAADYGSATTRKRLFVRASKRGAICWPQESHAAAATADRRRWKPARDVIDWSLKGESIFGRKRPLKPKTLARIEAGLRKFGGEAFIAVLRGTDERQAGSWAGSVEEPLKTISAGGIHAALCEPFILGQHSGGAPRGVSQPMPTICTESRGIALVQPFVLNVAHAGGERVSSCMDIRFRMLQPHELAAAMGFEGYEFSGTKTDQVRQIGNAVAVEPAEALCGSIMDAGR